MYEKKFDKNKFFWGSKYYILRNEFIFGEKLKFRKEIQNILVLFGGTDPLNLTKRLLNIISKIPSKINFQFVLGLGYKEYEIIVQSSKKYRNIQVFRDVKSISELMRNADLAISSQGRTMYELASMNVPTVILAQNQREMDHEFGKLNNGFVNLGLGSKVDDSTIFETLKWLINNSEIREQMYNKMKKIHLKFGLKRVVKIILGEEI